MRAGDGQLGRVRPFWLLRSRAQRGTLVSTGLVVVVIAFLASVMTGLALRSPDTAVRATLEHEPAAATSLALQASQGSDPEVQDAAVRSVVARQFPGVPLRIAQTTFVPTVAVAGGGSATLLVASDALQERARLTSGRWPASTPGPGAGEAAVDTDFARAHRLGLGDTAVLSGPDAPVSVTVVGIWRPVAPASAAWLGLASGAGGTDGRAIVSDALAGEAGDGTSVQWVLTPDADRITAAQLPRLRAGLAGVADALSDDSTAAASPFSSSGQALATTTAMERSVVAVRAVIPIPLSVLAVCAVIALALLGRLPADARLVETRLLRSRGVTLPWLARSAALESGAVALVAVIVGTAAGQLVLRSLTGGPSAGLPGAVDVLLPPLAALVAAVAAATLTTVLSARSLTDAPGAVEAGRGRTAVSAGLAVLAIIAAAVALWRVVVFSSSTASGDGGGIDPAGVVAPAAVLCAIALLGLSLFGPAAGAVERLAGRGPGVAGVLPARQVGRGIALFSGPVALIVLTVGALTFAAGYAGTFSGFLRDSTLLTTGGAVRADLGVGGSPNDGGDLSGADRLEEEGVTASPAIVDDATIGDTNASVIVMDTSRLPALVPVGGYLLGTGALAASLPDRAGLPGADLPADTRSVALRATTASATGVATPTQVTVWMATAAGEAVPITAQPAAAGDTDIALPDHVGRRLVAVDVTTESAGATDVTVAVTGLPVASKPAGAWSLAPTAFGAETPFRAAGTGRASAALLEGRVTTRFLPDAEPMLRVAVTTALAADDSLRVGQQIDVNSPVGGLTATVDRIVPALPGTTAERAVLADYSAVTAQLLRTTPSVTRASSIWVTGPDTAALERSVARVAGRDAVVTTAEGDFVSRFLSGAVLSTWLGAAGCALLAVAAVAAAISSALRRRRGEVIVLRAVGLSAKQQAWTRRAEVIGVSAAAVLFGLAGGVVVVLLVGNTLARLSVVTAPSTLSVQGRVDPIGMGVGLLALVAALAVAVWAYGRSVRRQAYDTAYREETR
ncbi:MULTISPECIES: FtsX-like permease family protein [unclassified Leifsonia]|uniref:FtsX-like permease family protein n=1 Tax=unclassified Leifsonia TaxID=2663824 RepID=UPI0003818FF9|nr:MULTISPECIES: FtsX-like permease family protein [unclassified Leifsonia]